MSNFHIYLKDISTCGRITHEEEISLGKRVKRGDQEALDKLITANLGLVVFLANKYRNKGIEYDDLISEGNFGLMTAAERWDFKRKIRFSTYAFFWIKKFMFDALNTKVGLVKTGHNLNSVANSVYNKICKMKVNGTEEMTTEEAVLQFGKRYKNHSIEKIMDKINIRYCGLMQENSNGEVFERPHANLRTESPLQYLENEDGKLKLKMKLKKILSEVRYGQIIDEIYGITCDAKSFEQLAKEHNVTQQAIHNWRTLAFSTLRKRHKFDEFVDYLQESVV